MTVIDCEVCELDQIKLLPVAVRTEFPQLFTTLPIGATGIGLTAIFNELDVAVKGEAQVLFEVKIHVTI